MPGGSRSRASSIGLSLGSRSGRSSTAVVTRGGAADALDYTTGLKPREMICMRPLRSTQAPGCEPSWPTPRLRVCLRQDGTK